MIVIRDAWRLICARRCIASTLLTSETMLPVLDLDHAVRFRRDVGVVRDEDDGVALAVQLVQQPHHLGAALAVERAGRLVGEDHAPAVHERARDGDALLLPAGKLRRPVVRPVGEAQRGEQIGRPRSTRSLCGTPA